MATKEHVAISGAEARVAGALYIGTILCGLFAEIGVRSRMVSDSPAGTLANIVNQPTLYRAGEVADLLMLCCYIAVTALLYRLFAPRALSLVAAGFSMTGIAVLAVAGVLHLAPLIVIKTGVTADVASVARLALALHGAAYNISLVFFGVYCLLIGWLCIASRRVPAAIGILMAIGGGAHIITKMLWVLSPAASAAVPAPINMLPLLGEAALALWLLIAGVRPISSSPSASAG